MPLPEVLAGIDATRPVIVMDHQPNRLDDAVAAGVDLQVSGHTHRGQVFPGNVITRRIFELDWGYLHKEATHYVVSVGYGTWGPPIRIGNRPEVVSIHVRFGIGG
jgi:predicted MPP superfamily phosphohydrolase